MIQRGYQSTLSPYWKPNEIVAAITLLVAHIEQLARKTLTFFRWL